MALQWPVGRRLSNKTDRNDARGIAQMMRVGLYKPVHVKTVRSQEIRMLLAARKFVQTKILDAENNLRGLARNFGLKVGAVPGCSSSGALSSCSNNPRICTW